MRAPLLAVLALTSPTVVHAAPPGDEVAEGVVANVSTRGIDQDAFLDALGLRVPDVQTRTQWDASNADDARLFVDVRVPEDGPGVDTKIVRDGKAFARHLDAEPSDTREIATQLANLLISIEEEKVDAVLEDVTGPATSETAEVERVVEQVEAATKEPEPETTPEPEPEPIPDPRPAPVQPPPDPPRPPHLQLGVPLQGMALLGLGPPSFGGTAQGLGVETGLVARTAGGALVGLRLRYLGREQVPFRIDRLRVAVEAGYAWRRQDFELPLTGVVGVEPWRVQADGVVVDDAVLGSSPGSRVGLDFGVRFEPGYLAPVRNSALEAVKIGAFFGAGGGFVVDGGPRVATVVSGPEGDALFRVGGFELVVGVGTTLWFGVPGTDRPAEGQGAPASATGEGAQ